MQDNLNNNLDEFVSKLLATKGMADEPERHNAILLEINDRINMAILEELPGDDLDRLEDSVENGTATEEGVKSLLENSEIDAEAVITRVLEDYRDEFFGRSEQ